MHKVEGPVDVNDVHSQLNRTRVSEIFIPKSTEDVCSIVRLAREQGRSLAISGCRHAMGGQQFLTDSALLDMRSLNQLIDFSPQQSVATFGAGANWADVQAALGKTFSESGAGLTFRQKQTGADRLTLGGAVAVNAHGRGLALQAFVSEIESLVVVDSQGRIVRCSRTENGKLFSLVCGGYGLLGVVTEITLRLIPRSKVRRTVEVIHSSTLMARFEERIQRGFVYGDFQFRVDAEHPLFLQEGVFSCYEPVEISEPLIEGALQLNSDDWYRLLWLAHHDKARAFEAYSSYYLKTSGQTYWSDLHQVSTYLDGYHARLDAQGNAPAPGSEMISELYVPRHQLHPFLLECSSTLRAAKADVVYGTVRLIEKDTDSTLTWARENWACIIFNLHVDHTPAGVSRAQNQFRLLIDIAIAFGGSYFLTYHRWANKVQLETCHPRIHEFLEGKKQFDPHETFSSDWYAALKNTIAAGV